MRKGSSLLAAAALAMAATGAPVQAMASMWNMSWRVPKPRHRKKSTGTHKQNRRKALRAKEQAK